MRLLVILAFLALAACSSGPGKAVRDIVQCDEPKVEVAHLEGRNAHNSVSSCLIRVDPNAPYARAIFAQELWEWQFKRRTGRSIGLRQECFSHEVEVQAAGHLWRKVDPREYRVREAHQMLASDSYAFKAEGWTHKRIFDCMRQHHEKALAYVLASLDEIEAFGEKLRAWRIANRSAQQTSRPAR